LKPQSFRVIWLESRGVAYSESCRDFPQPHEANFEVVSRNGSRELSQTRSRWSSYIIWR